MRIGKYSTVGVIIVLVIFLLPFVSLYINKYLGIDLGNIETFGLSLKDFFSIWIAVFGAIGIAINILLHQQRLLKQQSQIEIQTKGERNSRFSKAIELLGNTHESARIGAVHSLYFLAKEYKKEYREVVLDILCSHIRTTTMLKKYQEENEEAPSNEIKTIFEILFKKDYVLNTFSDGFKADLSGSFLQGLNTYDASLNTANLENVNFNNAVLTKIEFIEASIRNTSFNNAKLKNCNFQSATISNTNFIDTILDKACFYDSYIDYTNFERSKLYSPHFEGSNIINSHFCISEIYKGSFEGADISSGSFFICSKIKYSHFQGTHLKHLLFWGSSIEESSFDCAKLNEVNFEGCAILKTSMLGGGDFDLENKEINDFYKDDRAALLKKQHDKETVFTKSLHFGQLKENHKEIIKKRLKEDKIQKETIIKTIQILSANNIESHQSNFKHGIPNKIELDKIINKLNNIEKECGGWRQKRYGN